MYARTLPRIDQSVTVVYLAERVAGTVTSVDSDQRGLEVVTEEGDKIRFTLQPTTGRFQAEGQHGPRLYFDRHGIA
jgi:hypothetical protein